jgi:Putative restriction endonuclease
MPILVLEDPPPREVRALLERRRQSGLHRLDEVWEGVLHMVLAPSGEHAYLAQQLAVLFDGPTRAAGLVPAMHEVNVGCSEDDFRIPDGALHREIPRSVWFETLPLVVEIASPGDESWQKLPFYAAHGVDEVLIVEPRERMVHWLTLKDGGYVEAKRSGLIDLGVDDLLETIDWP